MKIKTGDTFDISGVLPVTVNGVAVTDFTGWTGRSQIRTKTGKLVAQLVFTWLNTAGFVRLHFAGTTQGWPVGAALIDVELTTPAGDVISSLTSTITVEQDITR